MRLEKYLITPSVLVHLENYKITMLGEVSRSGVYPINNEKISISEAIALAGDITPYGMRTNVLIVRETENGNPEYGYIDLTSNDVFKSPYYYLQPNDIVYVNARRTRVATGDFFYRVVPVVVSFATLISILYLRFSKYL
jgi:polysaccharide export outer membrane protein